MGGWVGGGMGGWCVRYVRIGGQKDGWVGLRVGNSRLVMIRLSRYE
jgi:hypothetical protein